MGSLSYYAYPALTALALAAVPSLHSSDALAQERSSEAYERIPVITITPTRRKTPAERVGSTITVVTAEEIERKQYRTLPEALRDVPGLTLTQTGGPGAPASVFVRGTNSNHTKILIDGMEASDPSTANGAFDFGQIFISDVERIEVLRGPQSGLYGSDAIGGVINVITRKGRGPAQLTASLEGGSFETFNQTVGLGGSTDRFSYAFDIGHSYSGDTPVTPLDLLPPGRDRIGDSYENTTYSTRLGADLTDVFGVNLIGRYAETSLSFTGDDDTVFPSVPAAARSRADNRQFLTRAEADLSLFDSRFDQTFGVGYVYHRRRSIGPDTGATPAEPSLFRGDRIKLDWQGALAVTAEQIVTAGIENETERLRDSPVSAETVNNAGYLQLQSEFGGRLFNAVSLRIDDNDRFGRAVTYRIAPSYLVVETGTRLKGSYGTGFKAPSLTQLFVNFPEFGFSANPNLRPEESRGYDIGFEQALFDRRLQLGATYFHNEITDLITSNATFTSLENRPEATTYGVEAFVAVAATDRLDLRGDYTFTITRDNETGGLLLRRPKDKASASARWRVTHRAVLALSALYVGPRIDGNRSFSIQRLETDDYAVVDLTGSYDFTNGLTAFTRIENLFDQHYENPTGFQRPGIGFFVGLKAKLDAESFDW